MFDQIRRFVREHLADDAASAAGPAPAQPPSVQVAACALLLELAHADGEFSPEERAHIERTLVRHFGLDQRAGQELMQLAEAARAASIDHYQFTRQITESYDTGQKMVLAEVMWGVILADGKLADREAWLIRKMASLMELEPAYLSEARHAAVEGSEPGPERDGPPG